jgi:hypothetical protein
MANCDEAFKSSGLGFQEIPKSKTVKGKTGKPNVQIFFMMNKRKINDPKIIFLKRNPELKTE